jgi:hypothetical protein
VVLQPVDDNHKDELMPSGRIKCIPLPNVCDWKLAAWSSTSPEIVEKRSEVTGIFNKMDGSEYFITKATKMKVRVMIMAMIAVLAVTMNDTNC